MALCSIVHTSARSLLTHWITAEQRERLEQEHDHVWSIEKSSCRSLTAPMTVALARRPDAGRRCGPSAAANSSATIASIKPPARCRMIVTT